MIPFLYNYGDVGILALRIGIAAMFLAHGTAKLNGKMGQFMLLIGVIETVGALLVLSGFMTQVGAIGLAVVMLGAIYKKVFEWKMPFSSSEKLGWEVDVALLGGCIALMTLGSGYYGLDYLWY